MERSLFNNKSIQIAKSLNQSEMTKSLNGLHGVVYDLAIELKPCVYFEFSGHDALVKLLNTENDNSTFWFELNTLITLCLKSSVLSMLKLLESMEWSYRTRNELLFASLQRSFIEHACTLEDLSVTLKPRIDFLCKSVWPSGNIYKVVPIDIDFEVRKELFKYILGRKVQLGENLPKLNDSNKEWNRYLKSIKNVPEELQSKGVMKLIDKTAKRNHMMILRTIYEALSEYVHPNSASRVFKFNQNNSQNTYQFYDSQTIETDGFRRLNIFGGIIIPPLTEISKENLQAINKSRMPMDPLDGIEEQRPGHLKFFDCHGREMWLPPNRVRSTSTRYNELTKAQTVRLNAIYNVISDVETLNLETWKEMFEKEADLERELQLYEHFVEVYEKELSDRVLADFRTRRTLFNVIQLAANYEAHEIILLKPELAMLPYLDRVVNRVRSRVVK